MYTGRLLGWTIRGSIPGRGKKVLPSPKRPDCLWGPPIPFSMGTEDFPGRGFRRWLTAGKWSSPLATVWYECGKCSAATTSAVVACARQPYVLRHKKNSVYAAVQNFTEKSGLWNMFWRLCNSSDVCSDVRCWFYSVYQRNAPLCTVTTGCVGS